jgi:hypothetical protein
LKGGCSSEAEHEEEDEDDDQDSDAEVEAAHRGLLPDLVYVYG